MAEFKIVLNDSKTGKSYQRELKGNDADFLIGKRIGDKITGETIDLTGYEFEIAGGSDKCGFPMRRDIKGATRAKILAVGGVGLRKTRKGMRKRKTVCGNTIDSNIAQVNMKIIKYGKAKLEEKAPAEKAEGDAASAEKPKEEKKEKQEQAPAEDKKEEAKEETGEETKEDKADEEASDKENPGEKKE
jgi:small subunit ribosomal protein S6e